MDNRNIVVIGASAGGIEATLELFESMDNSVPAAFFVVQHRSTVAPNLLPTLLDRRSNLPVKMAEGRTPIKPGVVYVAPSDLHLIIKPNEMLLAHGPRENGFRPAIDPTFRSAAVAHGPHVIGAILSGHLDDGAAGLAAVKRCGGLAIVQDPADAVAPSMPQSAMEATEVDYVVPMSHLANLFEKLVREPAGTDVPVPHDVAREVKIAEAAMSSIELQDAMGDRSPYVCPDCGGPLWRITDDPPERYRCHTGHGYTAKHLLAGQGQQTERALYSAMRIMEERTQLLERLARNEEEKGRSTHAHSLQRRAQESREHTEQIRALILEERSA